VTYAVKLSKGDYTVEIAAYKVEEDIQNQNVMKLARPIPRGKQDTEVPTTRIVDLKRIIHTIFISGYIEPQEIYDESVGHAVQKTATEAKNALIRYVLYPSGAIQLNWRGSSDSDYDPSGSTTYLSTILEKVKLIDSATRTENFRTSADLVGQYGEVKRYAIELNLVRGTVK